MKSKYILKRVFLFAIALIFATSLPAETYAYDTFHATNDIVFSDKNDTTCQSGEFVLSGKNNLEKIFNFLTGKGLNNEQAAGVLANIQHESGYSPTRHEQSHSDFSKGGYGLAQWTFGRRTTLEDYLKRTVPELFNQYYKDEFGGAVREADGFVPKNSTTGELMPLEDNDALLSAELNFLFEETSARVISSSTAAVTSAKRGDKEWEALKKATNVEDATKIWLYNFEIPANIATAAVTRSEAARTILSNLQALSGGSTTATTGSCLDTTSGDVTALQATVKLYAWPEYKRPGSIGATDLKPEYKAAVDKAVASGGYVGGIRMRGVDCGGFVTRVMIDSGYEPSYNSGKGPTGEQEKWLEANWEKLGKGNEIDTATLKPGDVAIQPGHTFMFAGKNIDGFGTTTAGWKGVASASLDERAPMAGLENLTSGTITWYRKKMVNHE